MSGSQHPKSGSQQVPSKDVLLGTGFDPIIARIKSVVGVKTDVALTKLLGIHQNSIRSARKRGSIPHKWLTKLAKNYTFDLDWILTGEGNPPGVEKDRHQPEIDFVDLVELIELIETRMQAANHHLPPKRKARAIVAAYKLWRSQKELAIDILDSFFQSTDEE